MKRILFILIGAALLLAPGTVCFGRTPKTNEACAAKENADDGQQKAATADGAETERVFHDFIIHDVAEHEGTRKKGNTYYYKEFPNANRAYNAVLNLIVFRTAAEKRDFDRTKSYETKSIAIKWSEAPFGEATDSDGFARIDVNFVKKSKKYTVVFCEE